MMHQLKVVTLLGTRPEIIKLSRVMSTLDDTVDHVIVHSGQNYDPQLSEVFFQELKIRQPDIELHCSYDRAAETIGSIISRFDSALGRLMPDAVLIYGDTNTCFGAISAKKRQIPIFHMEAGNRCFDERVPEEINRRLIDHISDVNFTNSEHARRYLISEGLRPERTINTGSPMREILQYYRRSIADSSISADLGLISHKYILVSMHRQESVDAPNRMIQFLDLLEALRVEFRLPIIVSTHPRTRDRLKAVDHVALNDTGVVFHDPFGFFDYIALQLSALCVLSDSGTITEEAAILGFPAVMLREAHERPEGLDAGVLAFTGFRPELTMAALELAVRPRESSLTVPDYGGSQVSRTVTNAILSFVPVVRRTLWYET